MGTNGMKFKKAYKKIFIFAIVCLLFLPMTYLLGVKDKTVVYGVEAGENLPSLQASSFVSREFQTKFERWWNTHFGFRKFMLKSKNQFYDWANFGKMHTGYFNNIIEGKDKYVFGRYFFYSMAKNCPSVPSFSKLLQFYDIARHKGIELYFIVAPSKVVTYAEYLPFRYKYFLGQDCHLNQKIAANIAKIGIPVYDSQPMINYMHSTDGLEPFPIGGIHWNLYSAGWTLVEAAKTFGWGKIEITKMEKQDTPYFSEQDLTNLMNLFIKKKNDIAYYRPIFSSEFVFDGQTTIIGDSFSHGFRLSVENAHLIGKDGLLHYENAPLSDADAIKVLNSKRIIFVYTDNIYQPNHQFYKKLDVLIKNAGYISESAAK